MLRAPSAVQPIAVSTPSLDERPLVLVVDPDRSSRSVLKVALERDGFDVWVAESSGEGTLVLRRGRVPDLFVLESDLGGDDGFSFCAQLRGDARTAQVPVVLLARASDENVANLASVVGVNHFIRAPAFARDVVSLVHLELARHSASPAAPLRFQAKVLPPAHLVRALLTTARSGTLELADGQARVELRDGRIVKARCGERWGIDALVRALALTAGAYTLQHEARAVTSDFTCTLRDFVDLVLPRLSRWQALKDRSLPLEACLAVDFARLAKALPSLPDDVNRVVQLFDGRRLVKDVIVDSAFDERLTLEVATRLYLMGVIGPLTAAPEVDGVPRRAPTLFEPRDAQAEALMRELFEGLAEVRPPAEAAAADDDDWAVIGASGELDFEDPAGGWAAASLPEAQGLLDGLSAEASLRLSAFNVQTVVEPLEPSAAIRPVVDFAAGVASPEGESLELAIRTAANDEESSRSAVVEPGQLTAPDADPTPPSAYRRAYVETRQDRIVTPLLTPAVLEIGRVAAQAQQPVAPVPSGAAETALTVEHADVKPSNPGTAEAEASFFAEGATVEGGAGLSQDASGTPVIAPPKRRAGMLAGLAVAALVVAVLGERLGVGESAAVSPPAPTPAIEASSTESTPPVALVPLKPVAEVEVEPAAPQQVDVAEPLADGIKAYQSGQFPKAVAVLEQVVADEPASLQGWLFLALARYDAQDAAGARVAAAKVLALEPRNAKVQVLLATLAADANDKAGMKAALETYLALEPNGPDAAEAKALLAR